MAAFSVPTYFAEAVQRPLVIPQGVDWRDPAFHSCNRNLNPTYFDSNDGQPVDPLEVMFIKYKRVFEDLMWQPIVRAQQLQRAYHHAPDKAEVAQLVNSNAVNLEARRDEMKKHPPKCLDWDLLLCQESPERRQSLMDKPLPQRWEWLLTEGYRLPRGVRWLC